MVGLQDRLAALLLTDPAIKAMVGNNVDWDVAAQGATGPRIVMFVVSEPKDYTSTSEVKQYDTLVQLDCRANTALQRRQLVAAVDGFLSGYRGSFGGVRIQGAFKEGHRTRFDMEGNTRWFQAQMDYRIWWAPA